MKNKKIIRIALITALILLIPLVTMQFTNEIFWSFLDFVFVGILLFGIGLTYELVTRKGSTVAYRAAVGFAIGTTLVLLWMNGAVGIIGNENNPANMMYFGVIAIGIIGTVISGLRPHGMALTSSMVAIAQMLVPAIALIIWKPQITMGILGVFVLNALFAGLWMVSALLFRRAAREYNGSDI